MSASALSAITFSVSSVEHVHEGLLGRGVILEVKVAPAQYDAGWYVVGVKLESGGQDAYRPLRIA